MNILTLGPQGTFSYYLTKKEFSNADIELVSTIDSIFENLGTYDKAVVPLENDISGFVEQSVEHLLTCEYFAERLLELPIRYNLVGFGELESIHTLFVFPYTYTQCAKHMKEILPTVEIEYTSSNGMSAKQLADAKTEGYAAIVPSFVDSDHNFPILEEEVQDCSTNTTRFLVLTKALSKKSGKLVCFLFSRGTLHDVEADLQKRGISSMLLKPVPMKEIDCSCYFLVASTSPKALEGYDMKILGYFHEGN